MTAAHETRPLGGVRLARVWLTAITGMILLATVGRAWWILTGITVIPIGSDAWIPPTALPQLLQLEWWGGDQRLEVTVIPWWIRLLSVLALAVTAGTAVLALFWTRVIVTRIGRGDPFHPEVPRTLKRIAIVLVSGAILRPVLDMLVAALIHSWWRQWLDAQPEGLGAGGMGFAPPHFPATLFTVGVVAGCLVLAFRVGARLREDAIGVV